MRRPTLEAVAARAGVSRATVSRVVNGGTTVTAELREAVMRAVDEMGYVPNLAARSLVTQRTDSIALVAGTRYALVCGIRPRSLCMGVERCANRASHRDRPPFAL